MIVNTRCLATPTTGVQRYLTEILRERGSDVQVIAPSGRASGVPGHLWEQVRLPRLLQGRLLWSPSNTGPLSVKHQVVTIHDASPLDHPEWFAGAFGRWYGWLLPRLAVKVRRVITDSEFTKSRLVASTGISPDQVDVVYLGADAQFQPQSLASTDRVRKSLGIPDGPYVLAVGSLEPRKNLARLTEAWRDIQGAHPTAHLVIAGGKGIARVFQQNALDIPPRTVLTGYVPDALLPSLYAGAEAFAYPSLYEGFGLPPLEAMSCGTPVLTSSAASLPEVVGDAALMVDPMDVKAIADGLHQLLFDEGLRDQLRVQGLARSKCFSWQTAAAETWKILEGEAES